MCDTIHLGPWREAPAVPCMFISMFTNVQVHIHPSSFALCAPFLYTHNNTLVRVVNKDNH